MEVKTKGNPNSEASEEAKGISEELKLGGNIILVGFSLEPAEMIVVKKIVGNYARKISEKISYEEIKITLKAKQKAKSFLHEVQVDVKAGGNILTGNVIDHNLYTALSKALEKTYSQAEHKERTSRQEG